MQGIRIAEGCARCPELVANRCCIVHGYGAPDAGVCWIGEAPGYKGGDRTGIPFTRDRSGLRLQRLLIELGLSTATDPRVERPHLRCYVTNVVRCNPPANRTPRPNEIENCLPHLWQELDLLRPLIVVPIGNVALRAVFPRLIAPDPPAISQVHARVFSSNGVTVVPMRHPARISNADLDRFQQVMAALLPT